MVRVDWKRRRSKRLPVFDMDLRKLDRAVLFLLLANSQAPYISQSFPLLVLFSPIGLTMFIEAAEYAAVLSPTQMHTRVPWINCTPSHHTLVVSVSISLMITCNPFQGLTAAPVKMGCAKLGSTTCPHAQTHWSLHASAALYPRKPAVWLSISE